MIADKNHPANPDHPADDIQRLNYYEKQYLQTGDFRDEQAYHIEMRRRHLIAHHSWGIVLGLEISQDATSKVWAVQPGMAIDGFGREIILPIAEPLNINQISSQLAHETTPAYLKIWMAYRVEKTNRPAPGYEVCGQADQYTRLRETFRLIYQDDPPSRDRALPPLPYEDLPDDPAQGAWPVYLGTVVWDVDPSNPTSKIITSAEPVDPRDSAARQYLGLVGAEIVSPTRALAVNTDLASFAGNAAIAGTVGDGNGVLRLDVDSADASVITNKKAPISGNPNPPSKDIYLRTNNESGGNKVIIDKDTLQAQSSEVTQDLTVDGKITVQGTVGDGSGKLHVESGANDLAVLTRPADDASAATHNLAIRSNDGSGGNKVLVDQDGLTAQSLEVTQASLLHGDLTIDGSKILNIHGGQIAFKEASGSEDTDPIRIFRVRRAADNTDMRLQIGDNLGGGDRLVVGPIYTGDGQFKEQLVVVNNGDVQVARDLDVAGALQAANLFAGLNFHIGAGQTPQGATSWQVYNASGIYVDVSTSAAGFSAAPLYITSLHGTNNHWSTTGGSSVYSPTAAGFRIYLRWVDGAALTPAMANANGWHIQWIGIQV